MYIINEIYYKNMYQLMSTFVDACKNGDIEKAKKMYSLGNINIHADNEDAFKCSCTNGHIEVAKWLYSLGDIDIHVYNEYAFIRS